MGGIMSKVITDKYKDLHHYHSGGGCVHLMLESSVDEYKLQWLINPLEKNCDDEPSYNLNRITEDARCMFGLCVFDYEFNDAQKEILDSIEWTFRDSIYFQLIKPFKDGYEMMKDIDNRLTNAPTWEDC